MAENPASPLDPQPPRGTRPRGLGRGLGALIPGAEQAPAAAVVEIPIDRIRPNSLQPRTGFDESHLAELEASVREHGILQPVLVRPSREGYEIVAGERRLRAATAAGLRTVPAVIRHLDDRGALEAALVENLQREDLSPIERARAYKRLVEEFGLNQEAVARRVGRSQPSVANTLRLLELPLEVQRAVETGRITEGHARALLGIVDPAQLLEAWKSVEARGLSVRQTEALARKKGISREIRRYQGQEVAGELNIIQQHLSERLGAPVRISANRRGAGEIQIAFFSPEDLERLLTLLEAGGADPR
ncbi:MAG: ParB/RepB/Spo0J family partition protein [Armatimonadetes bacterium]|nr:ParB/RepB/Spo0J family partition protein [Armatimonadota bacterium]